jgi:hypothetical protein
VCALSGALAHEACASQRDEWLLRESARPPCAWHGPGGLSLPSDYASWSPAEAALAAGGAVRVVYPASGATFWLDDDRPLDDQGITLRAAGGEGSAAATWWVDGRELATLQAPWRLRWLPEPGEHELRVVIGGVPSEPVRVRVGGAAAAARGLAVAVARE